MNDQASPINIVAQVAEVGTALGSVYKMVQSGNIVHFEKGNHYIKHMPSGKVTPMTEKGGAFEVGIWLQEPDFTGQDR